MINFAVLYFSDSSFLLRRDPEKGLFWRFQHYSAKLKTYEMNTNMEFEEEFNPWNVSYLEEFLYFCCPECDFRSPGRDANGFMYSGRVSFMKHALIAHPRAKNLIDKQVESRLNLLSTEESGKSDNMDTEMKRNDPITQEIKTRNNNAVSEKKVDTEYVLAERPNDGDLNRKISSLAFHKGILIVCIEA